MRLLISGGGTGGHIYPALALIKRLKERHQLDAVLYVGTKKGLEADIVTKAGIPFETIEIQGFRRKLTTENITTINKFRKSLGRAKTLIQEFQPDIVIGTGGYVCAPVCYEASRLHIPTMIHEQNSVAGLSNKFLAHFVDRVAYVFPEVAHQFSEQKKLVQTGNPRAQEVSTLKPQGILSTLGMNSDLRTLLIVGGSRGAEPLNKAVIAALPELSEKSYQVLFITGRALYDNVRENIGSLAEKPNIKVLPYLDNLSQLLPEISVLCGRSGATTLAEITALGIPSILIPSPYVTHDHQNKNADYLVKSSAAVLLPEVELNGRSLVAAADHILLDSEVWQRMHMAALSLATPDASDKMISEMLSLIRQYHH
ncbi:undecaprenyldiphospho-muramoylpentapeptide beta-N-acetylglucosaminyltransferase [Lapidilactobacillus mulanensis]|uniref:UDP-N-acetylglucosamine--N-acetylmuramyl-(pentapeptide) pyrophosphoryl-undecaprenol N-acetylglucosamine transferase n=1 Tax=Lapidilactobacillus mulanensis TaxID=2485999 RepID=A0ABW4DKS3_9LACO|nr:undecaprenyldiphospho-muramoylpentapeptide beta-N-acetylglucosaminyltransferase [Lapidilactobacillus mulanensis]